MSRRVIVAGGRDFDDYALLSVVLDEALTSRDVLVSGGARGADRLGERYAKEHELHVSQFLADWDKYGKRAGYIRNTEMALYAQGQDGMLVAFWDGESRGTKHMIDLAREFGLKVHVIHYVKEMSS